MGQSEPGISEAARLAEIAKTLAKVEQALAGSPFKLLPVSDLAIPSDIEKPPVRFMVTRIPFDDYFTLKYFKEGREVSEELEAKETLKWVMDHYAKAASFEQEKAREEAIGKALDECWNFYEAVINIPADLYVEPAKRFPQFQPQV